MTDVGPLRVVLPAWTLVPGAMGGTETYARGLVGALDQHPGVDLTVLVGAGSAGVLGSRHEVVSGRGGERASAVARLGTMVRGLLPDTRTREALRSADVVHHPFTVPTPSTRRAPRVTSLADVQHLDLPQLFTRAERAYRAVAYDRAARTADAVITVSEFSRQRIVDRLGVDSDKVHVVPHGVHMPAETRATRAAEVVLYPARAWPHKNHARLVEAVRQVRHARPGLRLVLTGGGTERLRDLPTWVDARGHVTRPELLDLYSSAACLAFPSLYEGFGLPVLEALSVGLPVAASGVGSVPEVSGGSAEVVDPLDPGSIADGINRALEWGPAQVSQGRAWARRFTWELCASRTVAVYDAVARRR